MAIALLLLVPRLGDRYLWEDEAETALLARNVVRHGVPLGWDGRDLVSQECGTDVDGNGLWRHTPWLPIYVVAASFRALGIDAATARLPFVLIALATLPCLWWLGLRLFAERRIALAATAALALSVPFLLHARQSRYYALAALAVVWILIGWIGVWHGRRGAIVVLAVALTALFHTNYLILAATLAGLAASLAAVRPDRSVAARLGIAAAVAAAANAPWLLLFDLGAKADLAAGTLSPGAVFSRLGFYARGVELHLFPVGTLLVVMVVAIAARRWRGQPPPPGLAVAIALALFCLGYVVTLCLTPLVFFRYLIALAPVLALLTGYAVTAIARPPVGAALLLALVVTVDRADLAHLTPGSPLAKYVDEITHDFQGPIETVATFLEREAKRTDRVYITYGALGLRFHTGLEVRGGTACQRLDDWPWPEWLVVRSFFRLNPLLRAGWEDAERVRRWVNTLILSHRYRRIELPAVDIAHDARPEPDGHHYRMPREGRRVGIWRRIDP